MQSPQKKKKKKKKKNMRKFWTHLEVRGATLMMK